MEIRLRCSTKMPTIQAGKQAEVRMPVRGMSTGVDSGLRWYWHLFALCAAIAIVISRRPDAIFHAQFYAEDGRSWFADAYNRGGFTSLFRAEGGYFQTLPRLAAALALLAPLAFAPLVANLTGLLVQILPVPLLLSRRLSNLGSLQFRIALAAMYLAIPNCSEINVTPDYGQFHLAMAACLVVLASVPEGTLSRSLDVFVLSVFGLSGPLCLALLPVALIYARLKRDRWRRINAGTLALASAIQLCGLLLIQPTARAQAHPPLGANFEWLARILAGHVYLGALIGGNVCAAVLGLQFLIWVSVIGTGILLFWIFRAELEFRLFAAFCILAFAAALESPFVSSPVSRPRAGMTAWHILAGAPAVRYWFLPTLMFCWMVVWFVFARERILRRFGVGLLCLMLIGIMRDWRHPAFEDAHFEQYARRLESSPKGTALVIPQNPRGWSMRLVKR
jgi:hypothetical protein